MVQRDVIDHHAPGILVSDYFKHCDTYCFFIYGAFDEFIFWALNRSGWKVLYLLDAMVRHLVAPERLKNSSVALVRDRWLLNRSYLGYSTPNNNALACRRSMERCPNGNWEI